MSPRRRGVRATGRVVAASAAALAAAVGTWLLTGTEGLADFAGRGADGAEMLQVLADGPAPAPIQGSTLSTSAGSRILTRDATLTAGSRSAPTRTEVPTRLVIPALGAQLPVAATGLDDAGFMALPESPATAGWYRFGPAPGSGAGATVLAAHVDTRREGPGPLARLQRLSEGDLVEVITAKGRHHYQVVSVDRLEKSEVDMADLFSRTGPERVHVVTCGGAFDATLRRYEDNVIAVAVRVEVDRVPAGSKADR